MLCGDALQQVETSEVYTNNSNVLINLNAISLNVISEIQKELETYDLISLVFLLYDVPDTALQRLVVLQRIAKDIEGNHLNLLSEWALHASKQEIPNWQQQFLEALAICQLYSIIRKLGFDVSTVKGFFSSNKLHLNTYIHPMKKALYQLCESMTLDTFENFKKTLYSFDQNVMQYSTCELVFLQLMCDKFITINHFSHGTRETVNECKVEKLIGVMEGDFELKKYATFLRDIEKKINSNIETLSTNAPETETKSKLNTTEASTDAGKIQLNEICDIIAGLNLDDLSIDLKSDREAVRKGDHESSDLYPIKNKERVGICCIINQEVFHPSRDSFKRGFKEPLKRRDGSTKDKILLEKTMRSLKFDIMTKENINRKEMIAFIQQVTQKRVSKDDSVFMLCILSHGIRGHVYAADSVAIKVDYIQNLLDDALLLREIPKVLVIQACQVESEDIVPLLAADGPQYHLRKMDFLVYWATAPELEAFRHPELGSLFIQILCGELVKNEKRDHLSDLFTRVTRKVTALCKLNKCDQVPICQSTFTKNLILQKPVL